MAMAAEASWFTLQSWVVRLLVPLAVAMFAVIGLWVLTTGSTWSFGVRAHTASAIIEVPESTELKWDLSGALLCVRKSLDFEAALQPVEANDVYAACGSRRHLAYRIHPEQELMGVLGTGLAASSSEGSTSAHFAILDQRKLVIALTPSNSRGVALRLEDIDQPIGLIEQPVMIVLDLSEPGRDRLFPYLGVLRVGDDVSPSARALLEAGEIQIYRAAGDTVGGRALVESVELMLGDTIRLGAETQNGETRHPRGFVRVSPAVEGERLLMDLVGYGIAEQIKVDRFGEAGFAMRPSRWARLTNSDPFVLVSLIVVGLLSLLAGLAESRSLIMSRPSSPPKDEGAT
tara:strand:- start:13377 stop:14411 length:1035 start_codon:yes stop_codon:yes gene_type:complete